MNLHPFPRRSAAIIAAGDSFEVLNRIPSVVLIYGNGRRLYADEHNHGGRLLRTLDQLGRDGIAIRNVIRADGVLCASSLRALNTYLRHGNGLTAFRRVLPWHAWRHKHAWHELQRVLALRWVS